MNCVRTVLILFVTIILTACEHKELCTLSWWDHVSTPEVRVDVDWSNFGADAPEGMTLTFFSTDTQSAFSVSTNDIYSYNLRLPAGTYHVSVINLSPDELDTVEFVGMQTGSTPEIVGKSTKMPSFMPQEYIEDVTTEPQVIGSDIVYNVVVPGTGSDTIVVNMVVEPVLYTVDIGVEVLGYSRVQKVYGVLTGLSSGYNAVTGEPLATTASYEIADWTLTPLDLETDRGVLTSSTRIFGVCPVPEGAERDINLKIYMLMADGRTVYVNTFAVGECFDAHVNRHYSIYILPPLQMPEIDDDTTSSTPSTPSTGSGFDANVSDWGDEIIIEIK